MASKKAKTADPVDETEVEKIDEPEVEKTTEVEAEPGATVRVEVLCAAIAENGKHYLKGETFETTEARVAALGTRVRPAPEPDDQD